MSVSRLPTLCMCGDHAFAAATLGAVVLVSPEDAAQLLHKWIAVHSQNKRSLCIVRSVGPRVGRKRTYLSREIMQPTGGLYVDHANGDPTDNRRPNLRLATPSQNSFNRRKEHSSKSPYKGVLEIRPGAYRASIMAFGKRHYLGIFAAPELAAEAYALAAVKLHGEFARAA